MAKRDTCLRCDQNNLLRLQMVFTKAKVKIKIVANDSQVKFTILHVPHIGFPCYFDSDEILQ